MTFPVLGRPSGEPAREIDLQSVIQAQFGVGAFSWTAPQDGALAVMLIGGSGAGAHGASGVNVAAGGGGAYCRKTTSIKKGEILTGYVGAGGTAAYYTFNRHGQNSTASVPGLFNLVAGAGKGASDTNVPGAGGSASGGDVNSSGGNGGAAGVPGQPGVNGGAGGGNYVTRCGGGGGAGGDPDAFFKQFISSGKGVNGGQTSDPLALYGGGGGSEEASSGSPSPHGFEGRAAIYFIGFKVQ